MRRQSVRKALLRTVLLCRALLPKKANLGRARPYLGRYLCVLIRAVGLCVLITQCVCTFYFFYSIAPSFHL